jgi:hypothetical protein
MDDPLAREQYEDFDGIAINKPLHVWYRQKLPMSKEFSYANVMDLMRGGTRKSKTLMTFLGVTGLVSGSYGFLNSLSLPLRLFLRTNIGEVVVKSDRQLVALIFPLICIGISFYNFGFKGISLGLIIFCISLIIIGNKRTKEAKKGLEKGVDPLFTGYSIFYSKEEQSDIYTFWKQKEVLKVAFVGLVVLAFLDMISGAYLLVASGAFVLQEYRNYSFNRKYALTLMRMKSEQENIKDFGNQSNEYQKQAGNRRGGATI